jgi:hypothetical protein
MDDDRAAEYRHKPEECRAKAAKATDSDSQFEWITMAKGWELLASHAEKDENSGSSWERA